MFGKDTLHHPNRAKDTLEHLNAERGPLRHSIYWVLWLVVGLSLVLLPIVKVDVTVSGAGRLRPEGELAEVRAAAGGKVARVLATENQPVEQGELLVEIAAPGLEQRRHFLHRRLAKQERQLEDLAALLSRVDPGEREWLTEVWSLAALQHRSLMRQLEQEVAQRGREWQRIRELGERGLVTPQELELAEAAATAARAARDLAWHEAEGRWQGERSRLEEVVEEGRTELAQVKAQLALHAVAAPVAGEVMGIERVKAGQVVGPGEVMAVISPAGRLRVDARVGSEAVGFLREGMRARVLVDAFPHTEWGALEATVEAVAPDAVPDDDSRRPYQVRLRLETDTLRRPDGVGATVKKGMQAEVRFRITRRSLWHWLVQDAAELVQPGATEPLR